MNRNLPTFYDAAQRVKIGPVALKYDIDITGVIHVGTNYGYEIKWYLAMGIPPTHILGFEPLRSAYSQFRNLYPDVLCFNCALGNKRDLLRLTVPAGDGQGATLLRELTIDPNTIYLQDQPTEVYRFDHLYGTINSPIANCLVIDVQGYEMQVLEGFGIHLDSIDLLSVELSETPMYENESPAWHVVKWLNQRGFSQVTPVEPHNDVMFIRKPVER